MFEMIFAQSCKVFTNLAKQLGKL